MTKVTITKHHNALNSGDREALEQFKRDLLGGSPWYFALLDAVALWSSADESLDGQQYRYLVANEAFDWLRLAERLCAPMMDVLPAAEVERLLFHGVPPIDLDEEEFRRRIGTVKYRAHLNFFYGVTVEQALVLTVEDEIRKEALCGSLSAGKRDTFDVHERVYGLPVSELLERFRTDEGRPEQSTTELSLDDQNAFLYWLFKYRLKWLDGARVASDTKKGLTKLQQMRRHLRPSQPAPEEPVLVTV